MYLTRGVTELKSKTTPTRHKRGMTGVACGDRPVSVAGPVFIDQSPVMFRAFNCSMKLESRFCWSGAIWTITAPKWGGRRFVTGIGHAGIPPLDGGTPKHSPSPGRK